MTNPSPTNKFPHGFFWGAATASHQVEGGQQNDWSAWELRNAERLARESKGAFEGWNPHWKKFSKEATDPQNYISGTACDSWNRFEEDFDLLKELHLNAYRFSVEWSRIEPREGEFDKAALERYRTMIHSLRRRGIEPFVTLWHWTIPLWLSEKGGVLTENFPAYFARFAEKVALEFRNDVTFWITENEPDVYASHAYLKGTWPPEKKSMIAFVRALHRLIAAHNRAYRAIKKEIPTAQIGVAKHQVYFEMGRPTLLNRMLKFCADLAWNRYFLARIREAQDFIGLNHYNRNVIDGGFRKNPNAVQTDFGWEYAPGSLYGALRELERYGKLVYITENGIADASDELRRSFIPAALSAVLRAIGEGVPVRGYFYWSLLDNFEWDKGYWLKFGLAEVNRATMARSLRPSARVYGEIARKNSL